MSNSGHANVENTKDWTETQANQITELYKGLHGEYQKEANKRLFEGPQLPYEEAHGILNDLLKRQEGSGHEGGLENKVKNTLPILDLGAIAATAGLFAIAPPLGAVAGALYIMSKYKSSKTKPAHP